MEMNLGRGVSAAVGGLVLPRREGGINGGGLADLRVSLLDGERVALALGVSGSATYSSGTYTRHVPASAHAYAVGTVGSDRASATLGLGVRAQGQTEYDRPDRGCPQCLSFDIGDPVYRVRVRSLPVLFGGAEAKVAENGPFGYRLVAEGMALPVDNDAYSAFAGGGLRITHKRARLDLGAMVLSEPWGRSERSVQPGPWVGFTAGL
jgi:hypothetical protein